MGEACGREVFRHHLAHIPSLYLSSTMWFGQRVAWAAALAVAEVDVLVVQRADFGAYVAANPGVVLVAFGAHFLLDYLGLCLLSAAAWLRGFGTTRQGQSERADQPGRGKSTSRTASCPDPSWIARTTRAPAGSGVPPSSA